MAKTIFPASGMVLSSGVMNGLQNHDHKGKDENGSCPQLTLADLSPDLFTYLQTGFPTIGEFKAYGGVVAPYGWLACDGSAVPSSPFYDAFRAWIDVYAPYLKVGGAYYVPDLVGRSIIGSGHYHSQLFDERQFPLGKTGGEAAHYLTISELVNHSHISSVGGTTDTWCGSGAVNLKIGSDSKTGLVSGNSLLEGDSSPHNNMPPYFVGNWVIRVV